MYYYCKSDHTNNLYHNCFGNSHKCTGPCDNLPPLFNGMITYNTSQGLLETVATYTCNDGFTLLGSHLRICEEGVWEEASPSCLQDGKVTTLCQCKQLHYVLNVLL